MQGLDTCGGRGWWMAKQQKGSKGKRAGRGKGVCVLSSSVWCRGEELRFPACVPPPDHPLPPYLLASHPHQRLLTGYTANGHPYRFYNSIYVNTHLSNDWSGFELNPFPPTTPRASYRSAELLRQLLPPTGPPPGRMYLASLHRLRAFGRHLALHRRAQKSILTSVHLFPLVSLPRYKTLSLVFVRSTVVFSPTSMLTWLSNFFYLKRSLRLIGKRGCLPSIRDRNRDDRSEISFFKLVLIDPDSRANAAMFIFPSISFFLPWSLTNEIDSFSFFPLFLTGAFRDLIGTCLRKKYFVVKIFY